ncbi:YdcF family protein [Parvularcula marina]|uniref:YdcF family protein n=1 Tax=Parvularcula marina TaxID=2292771 RepID=A0A371RJK1_9PROT|nr:YdcF family protein [Parvularcula marina]RFB05628.1 YdcF family protein [Parvularcula marina]
MRVFVKLLAGIALGLVLGFFIFVGQLPRERNFDMDRAMSALEGIPRDKVGIVVFTGGSGERIERALKLYETGLAERVLISGTHPQVTKNDLAATGDRTLIECCVDLGPRAQTTIGNALEARDWAVAHGYEAVVLVTSEFHLPRAAVELKHAAPKLTIVSVPVASRLAPDEGWMTSPKVWNLLSREYAKFLLAYARSLT